MGMLSTQEQMYWMEQVSKLEASAMTLGQYARQENLAVHRLRYWRDKKNGTLRSKKSLNSKLKPNGFAKVEVETFEDSYQVVFPILDGGSLQEL